MDTCWAVATTTSYSFSSPSAEAVSCVSAEFADIPALAHRFPNLIELTIPGESRLLPPLVGSSRRKQRQWQQQQQPSDGATEAERGLLKAIEICTPKLKIVHLVRARIEPDDDTDPSLLRLQQLCVRMGITLHGPLPLFDWFVWFLGWFELLLFDFFALFFLLAHPPTHLVRLLCPLGVVRVVACVVCFPSGLLFIFTPTQSVNP